MQDLQELSALLAVAEAGSFTAAAERMGRDASVLSRRVAALEQSLGVRLLTRTTRRVSLTEAGAAYCRRIQPLLEELASAGREASEHAARPQGLVRVSLPVTFGRHWVAPLVPRFLLEHPEIRLELRFSDRVVDLVADGFDLAIRVAARPLRDSSLTLRRIAGYRNMLVAAPSYLAVAGVPQAPEELARHACLGFTGHADYPDWVLARGEARHRLRPAFRLATDLSEMALQAAVEGAGITLTPDWLAGPGLRDGRLAEILPGWGGPGQGGVYAVLPPGHLVPARTRLFVEAVTKAIRAGWR
ncbi:LysR family transcriptional regulator [Teichococcus deserti]|uniref:LysR family transcriptional regulator n=1 Tax=Teichococcus deserti TaxID=1817963 RepID=UPI001A95816D|nr:LysR family transcriptional regulator [Pseudoroseomonas deserti]